MDSKQQSYSYTPLISRTSSQEEDTPSPVGLSNWNNNDDEVLLTLTDTVLIQSPSLDFVEKDEDTQTQMTPLHTNMTATVLLHHPEDKQEEHGIIHDVPYIYSRFSHSWNAWTCKYQGWIVSFLPILLLASLYFMPQFTQYTDSTFHPVPHSPSAEAVDIFRTAFGKSSSEVATELTEEDPMNPGVILVLDIVENTNNTNHDTEMMNQTFTQIYSPMYNATRDFASHIPEYMLHQLYTTLPLSNNNDTHITIRVVSFFSYQDNHLPLIGQKLVSSSGKNTVLFISFSIPFEFNSIYKKKRMYIDCILDSIQEYGNVYGPPNVHIGYTGLRYFDRDIAQGVYRDLQDMDWVVVPLALMVLSLVLGGTWAVGIPILTLGASVSIWSIIMSFVVQRVQITQITPTVMMSLTLGIGLDYSLFLLSRLFSELNDIQSIDSSSSAITLHHIKYNAIHTIIQHTGGTILASGTTLALTFLGMLIIPLPAIQSIAIGATVAIASTIVCNLTFIPAIMHTPFLMYSPEKKKFICSFSFLIDLFYNMKKRLPSTVRNYLHQRRLRHLEAIENGRSNTMDNSDSNDYIDEYVAFRDLIDVNESTTQGMMESYMDQDLRLFSPNFVYLDESILSDEAAKSRNNTLVSIPHTDISLPQSSIWVQITIYLLNPKYSVWILIGIFLLLFPLALKCRELKLSLSMNLILPQGCPSFETFKHLGNVFGHGVLSPYRLIFDGSDTMQHMDSEHGFVIMHQFLEELSLYSSSHHPVSFLGIAWSDNVKIPFSVFQLSRICTLLFKDQCPLEPLRALSEINSRSTSSSGLTTFVTCILPFSAFSDEGVAWLETTREKIQKWHSAGRLENYKIVLEGEAAIEYDALDAVYASFPWMIVITCTIVFFILYLFTRSVLVPVRSICSISLTLFVVFGSLVLVYQDGILNGLQIPSLHGTGEISWLAPILAFSVTIGLGLDYDLFVTSRVLELRMEGYSHNGSIAAGLYYTGKIVTAAGIIMAIAFGGLLMSTSPILNQWSFLLTCAVLVDTFVVRTIIVPILLQLLGDFAWWPKALPKPQTSVLLDGCKL